MHSPEAPITEAEIEKFGLLLENTSLPVAQLETEISWENTRERLDTNRIIEPYMKIGRRIKPNSSDTKDS